MKTIFLLTTLFAASFASQIILPLGTSTRVHSQDAFGQYYYGYNDGLSTKQELRSFDGTTRGSYSYVDANGKIQTVDYIADPFNGFRVAGTNLPKPVPTEKPIILEPVKDTPEVAAAKKEHEKAVDDAKKGIFPAPLPIQNVAILEQPKPVTDTPEVVKAKEEHFAAKKQAELLAKQPRFVVNDPLLINRPLAFNNGYIGLNGYNAYSPFVTYNPYGLSYDYRYTGLPGVPVVYSGWYK